jgi:hypothetical protein
MSPFCDNSQSLMLVLGSWLAHRIKVVGGFAAGANKLSRASILDMG